MFIEEESETRRERSDKGPPAQDRTFKLPWASGGDSEIPQSSAYGPWAARVAACQ